MTLRSRATANLLYRCCGGAGVAAPFAMSCGRMEAGLLFVVLAFLALGAGIAIGVSVGPEPKSEAR